MEGPDSGVLRKGLLPGELYKRAGLVAGPVAFGLIAFVPSGLHRIEGMGNRPAYAAAAAALMAIWWFTEALPIYVTACAPLVLFPALGIFGRGIAGDAVQTGQTFLDAYIFLFMGGMVIGAAMEQHGLHRRVALHIMRAIGTDPRRLLLGVLMATGLVSMWISNTATAVMMMPIGMALLSQLEAGSGRRLSHFGAAVMLAVAYGANVGGMGTKIGTATNSIFVGFLAEKMGYDVSFLRFMALGAPFVLLFTPVVWWVLWRHGRADAPEDRRGRELIDRELAALGALSKGERIVAGVFVVAAVLWVLVDPLRAAIAPLFSFKLLGKHCEAAVAMGAALVLVGSGQLSFASFKRVPWGALLLLGGSFALAAGIEGSGLSRWLGFKLEPIARLPAPAQHMLAAGASVALSAVASNTATVNVVLNLLPRSPSVLAVSALASSCDFALPAGTPPNAIVFGSGYIRLPVMIRVGVVLDALATVLLGLYGFAYARWLLP